MTHFLYIVKKQHLLRGSQSGGKNESICTRQGLPSWRRRVLLLLLTRLPSCVKHVLMFPSSSWNRPPGRPSTAAAERVKACTNCRERPLLWYPSTLPHLRLHQHQLMWSQPAQRLTPRWSMSFSSERFGTSRVPLNFTPLSDAPEPSGEEEELMKFNGGGSPLATPSDSLTPRDVISGFLR